MRFLVVVKKNGTTAAAGCNASPGGRAHATSLTHPSGTLNAACRRKSHYHYASIKTFTAKTMKRLITSILIAVVLYFLMPLVLKCVPHYRLAVFCITAGIVSFAISALMDKT